MFFIVEPDKMLIFNESFCNISIFIGLVENTDSLYFPIISFLLENIGSELILYAKHIVPFVLICNKKINISSYQLRILNCIMFYFKKN